MVGTSGDASFFSFQAFKPLNTFGGGLAWMRDAELARRVGEFADAEPSPSEQRVENILRSGKWQRTFIRPKVFTYSLFPVWWAASWMNAKPERYLWEDVRRLDPLPGHYRGKFSNVQAALGLAGRGRWSRFCMAARTTTNSVRTWCSTTTAVSNHTCSRIGPPRHSRTSCPEPRVHAPQSPLRWRARLDSSTALGWEILGRRG